MNPPSSMYALADANLRILEHSSNLSLESRSPLVGNTLFTIAPELEHIPEILQRLLDGSLKHWESETITRSTREQQNYDLRINLLALDTPGQVLLLYWVFPITHPHQLSPLVPRAQVLHELSTPMTYLRGYLEMLMDEDIGALNGRQQEMLRILQHSVNLLLQFTDQLREPELAPNA